MSNKEIVYWKTKDGTSLNVDDMDINHVRNAFKMLIKAYHRLLGSYMDLVLENHSKNKTGTNGDIAEFFNDEQDNLINHNDE